MRGGCVNFIEKRLREFYRVVALPPCRPLRLLNMVLSGEIDISRQHGCDAGDLLLLVHHVVPGRVALEVERHLPGHTGKNGEQVHLVGLLLEDMAQSLDKPGPSCGVTPGIETFKRIKGKKREPHFRLGHVTNLETRKEKFFF